MLKLFLFSIVSLIASPAVFAVVPIQYTDLAANLNARRKVKAPAGLDQQSAYIEPQTEERFATLTHQQRVELIDYVLSNLDLDTPAEITNYEGAAAGTTADAEQAEMYIKYLLGKKFMDMDANQELVNFSLNRQIHFGTGYIHQIEAIREKLIKENPAELEYLSIENMVQWIDFFAKPARSVSPPKGSIMDGFDDRSLREMPTSWWVELLKSIRRHEVRQIPAIAAAPAATSSQLANGDENGHDSDDDIVSITDDDESLESVTDTEEMIIPASSASAAASARSSVETSTIKTKDGNTVTVMASADPFDDDDDERVIFETAPVPRRHNESDDEEEELEEGEVSAAAEIGRRGRKKRKETSSPAKKTWVKRQLTLNVLSDGSSLIPARFRPSQTNHYKKHPIPEGTTPVDANPIYNIQSPGIRMERPVERRAALPALSEVIRGAIVEQIKKTASAFLSDEMLANLIALDPSQSAAITDVVLYYMSVRYVDWELYQHLLAIARGAKPMQTPEAIVAEFKAKYPTTSMEYLHPQDVYLAYTMYIQYTINNYRRRKPIGLNMDVRDERVIARFGSQSFVGGLPFLEVFLNNQADDIIDLNDDLSAVSSSPQARDAPTPPLSFAADKQRTVPLIVSSVKPAFAGAAPMQYVYGPASMRITNPPAPIQTAPNAPGNWRNLYGPAPMQHIYAPVSMQYTNPAAPMQQHVNSVAPLDEAAFILAEADKISASGRALMSEWFSIISEIQNQLAYTSIEFYGNAPSSTRVVIERLVLARFGWTEITENQLIILVTNFVQTTEAGLLLTGSNLRMYHQFLQAKPQNGVVVTYRLFNHVLQTIHDLLELPGSVYMAMSQKSPTISWEQGINAGIEMFRSLTRFELPPNVMRQITNEHIVFWLKYVIPMNLPVSIGKNGDTRMIHPQVGLPFAARAYLATVRNA